MQATISNPAVPDVTEELPWLRSALYDLTFFAFPWIPFLFVIAYGLDWQGDFSLANNKETFKLVATFLFALNFTHRNYTYFVTYGDRSAFLTRKHLFIGTPFVVFATVLTVYYIRHPYYLGIMLSLLAMWNLWHTIMQRHGIFRGYARKLHSGFNTPKHGRLDLLLLWSITFFAIALGTIFYLDLVKEYRVARPTVRVLEPIFTSYPVLITVVFGGVMLVVFGLWVREEWRYAIPMVKRLPRLTFLASHVSLFALILINPVFGAFAFGFSHSVEYLAYVHAIQASKMQRRQHPGFFANICWNKILLGALLLIGLQILAFYCLPYVISRKDVFLKTFLSGTAFIHFFYDGIIWKKSKPINKWVL